MKNPNRSVKAAVVILTIAISSCFSLSAQDFSSKWLFGKSYIGASGPVWENEGRLKATVFGDGVMSAVDGDGNPLEEFKVLRGRTAAGPFGPGDCFLFDIPVSSVPSGEFIGFDATLSAAAGAPVNWIVEWQDGGTWISGKKYRCHGPALGDDHRYTSIYQIFRLEYPAEGSVKVRLRALEGETIPAKEGEEKTAYAMFVTSTYIGALVKDFGAVEPVDTTKVLCIGNSFTYYHSCPVMLQQISWNEGHYIDMYASLKGGRTMNHHLSLATTDDAVEEGGYDYMLLQDQSQTAAKVGNDRKKNARLVADMAAMATKVRSRCPDCKAVLECTWAYPGKDYGGFGSIKSFDENAKKGVKVLAKACGNSVISPINEAFKYAREERPDIMLYHTDGHHQSEYGSYLKSCVNYLVLFGEPFGDNPADCGLDPKKTAILRGIAEKVVLKR